jgi:hypothetical protein
MKRPTIGSIGVQLVAGGGDDAQTSDDATVREAAAAAAEAHRTALLKEAGALAAQADRLAREIGKAKPGSSERRALVTARDQSLTKRNRCLDAVRFGRALPNRRARRAAA